MGGRRKNPLAATRELLTLQQEIIEKFGEEAIQEARKRLCSKCKEDSCFLYPITTKGEDCPYFKLKEK